MKYIPLNYSPNVSSSGKAMSPSLKMDDRGFPHVTWLEQKSGKNTVNYSFWDGSKWSYNEIPIVHVSNEEITYSPNSLVFDNDYNPYIVFSTKSSGGSILSLANYSEGWNFIDLEVDFEVGWIGVGKYIRRGLYSSSSSSSLDSSSSSSSIDSKSSVSSSTSSYIKQLSTSSSTSLSTSSSSTEILTSSSSLSVTSSSSSTDVLTTSSSSTWILTSSSTEIMTSSSTSSSSSLESGIFFATVYDSTNLEFKIYSISSSTWRLLGSVSASIDSCSTIRSEVYGRIVGVAYINDSSQIEYNVFDLISNTWLYSTSFQTLTSSLSNGEVVEMDIAGYSREDECVMLVGWLSRTATDFYVQSVLVDANGIETPSDYVSQIVETSTINVETDDEYIVNGYRKISVCVDDILPNIFVSGIRSKSFYITETIYGQRTWNDFQANIDCIASGVVINSLRSEYNEKNSIAFSATTGDIYYLEPLTSSNTFSVSKPLVVSIDRDMAFSGVYNNGSMQGNDIDGIQNNYVGCILKDAQRPLLITSNRTSNEIVRTGDILENTYIPDRDILSNTLVESIDVNQVNGDILLTKPNSDSVVICSQNELPVTISRLNIIGDLSHPLDAKFDFARSRIWIADMGNERVIGLDTNINMQDAQVVTNDIIYPHSLNANVNDGSVFVKAFVSELRDQGIVYHIGIDGAIISSFIFDTYYPPPSWSTSSSSSLESDSYPSLPMPKSMCYDHVRNKVWWVDGTNIYVADENNKQVQVLSIYNDGFYETRSIDIELTSGNAFVAAKDLHNWYLVQISSDNKEILARGYINL